MSDYPSRTTAEVLTDPRHADLIRQADDLFAAAERAFDLAESFDLFSQAVAVLRKIDEAEGTLWMQRRAPRAVPPVRRELMSLPVSVASTSEPAAKGAWTCRRCGYVGFWSGGPHCTGLEDAEVPY